ncbi:ankyrin repeat domain-containing protein, partial [Candidatus Dependentiae bacterium]|nr:ankyrin repeat domain-containing protein [Candidatus Dependentiae bacterium]
MLSLSILYMEVSMKKIGLLLVTGLLSLNLLQAQDRRRPLENPEEPVLQERRVQRDAEEIQEELFEHARRGNLQQVQELVAELRGRNENINPADARGETPLHYAAENGHIETVQFLVEAVREINIYVDTLPADDAGWTPLHAAARYGHEEVVRFLVNAAIDRGEDWGCDNEDGNTPLHLAAQSGAINVVRLLIGELGATIWDLNPINNQGRTPV